MRKKVITRIIILTVMLGITIGSIPTFSIQKVEAAGVERVGLPCRLRAGYNLDYINANREHSHDLYGAGRADDLSGECDGNDVVASISGTITVTREDQSQWCVDENGNRFPGIPYPAINTVIRITNNEGLKVTYYHHNEDYTATVADGYVNKGEKLATIGSRGCAVPGQNHIHFFVSRGGRDLYYNEWEYGETSFLSPVKIISGDINNDAKTDIALTGANSWNTLPVARSNGDGSFSVTNIEVGSFATWASNPNAKVVSGDFNSDGKRDIALTGVGGWDTIPMAFSNGDGSFTIQNKSVGSFGAWAANPSAKVVSGDFNADGKTDIALTGVSSWNTLPIAFSNGDGNFTIQNKSVGSFAAWAANPSAKIIGGDFNADGKTDIALTGVSSWNTLPVAFSAGDGNFTIQNKSVGSFAAWAANPNAKILSGDFNADGRKDIALTGVGSWNSIPIAFSTGDGNFTITNQAIGSFAIWASQ